MKKIFPSIFLIIFIVFNQTAWAKNLPRSALVPGGIAILNIPNPSDTSAPEVKYGKQRVVVVPNEDGKYWTAIVGIPLESKAGQHYITIKKSDGTSEKIYFTVKNKVYPLRKITIPNQSKVTPSPKQAALVKKQLQQIENLLAHWQNSKTIHANFILPVSGIFSSPYGQRRIFNNVRHARHTGLDIVANTGAPIQAAANGKVISTDDFFLTGKTVFINHGQGLISYYCHMDTIDVKPGQNVKQGEVIGTVGATGRVTGPHLHWSVSLNGAVIDPLLFVDKVLIAKTQEHHSTQKHQ